MNTAETAQAIDIALNTWAVSMQVAILVVFTVVFFALWVRYPRRDVFFWVLAWGFNLLALLGIFAVLAAVDHWQEGSIKALYLIYAGAKVWFAVLLIIGLGRHLNRLDVFSPRVIQVALGVTAIGLLVLFFSVADTLQIQIFVYLLVGAILLLGGGHFLLKPNFHPGRWLQGIMMLEGVIFLHHGWVLLPSQWGEAVPAYMTRVSFFHSISELVVGITCVLSVTQRVMQEIQNSNLELEAAQRSLRELVDEDPLTGLWNRRKLESYRLRSGTQAALVYVDIDRFKQVNDRWGHTVGDTCLKRVARGMRTHFGDAADLFRLGGDEFLAILTDQDRATTDKQIKTLKADLATANTTGPAISVSIGIERTTDQSSLQAAISAADSAMYKAKASR
ncbi:MAG: GGDEF domain-containing protein [Pseudomonadota bacterium]